MSCEDCATNFDLAYDMVTDRYADLLAAAEGVLPWLAGINTKGDPAMVDALTDVYMQLAAAIKKAKGQQ